MTTSNSGAQPQNRAPQSIGFLLLDNFTLISLASAVEPLRMANQLYRNQRNGRFEDVPLLSAARHLAEQGFVTGASDRNWASCEASVTLPANAPAWHRKMLTDPQTSGGLLVACAPERVGAVLGTVWHGALESDGVRRALLAEVAADAGRQWVPGTVGFAGAELQDAKPCLNGSLFYLRPPHRLCNLAYVPA